MGVGVEVGGQRLSPPDAGVGGDPLAGSPPAGSSHCCLLQRAEQMLLSSVCCDVKKKVEKSWKSPLKSLLG